MMGLTDHGVEIIEWEWHDECFLLRNKGVAAQSLAGDIITTQKKYLWVQRDRTRKNLTSFHVYSSLLVFTKRVDKISWPAGCAHTRVRLLHQPAGR